ncbi:iron(III) transport system substrate-binding protein [Haloechinothrix alba]|uniref:Iron(III) transport system substrate-binding protein n=1 Tax=Haloechinothrix alba TaxID=664784 RepID=A0A238VCI9_9PSEU|nr:extracellular solute-binding protein [Haloechinothrix alba]SNR31941.1 iron(III) transport system substrate-binding protein [Haloechinothrix alba]
MASSAYRRLGAGTAAGAVLVALAACGPQPGSGEPDEGSTAEADDGSTLTLYSDRDKELVGGIVPHLENTTGHSVHVRYGDGAELAAQLAEEGADTEADLFLAESAGTLGALVAGGVLRELPEEVLAVAPERFRASDGSWVATSARTRAIAYHPGRIDKKDLPETTEELVDEKWADEVGYAPEDSSWQTFVSGLRLLEGDNGARDWLTDFAQNDPAAFPDNASVLDAVGNGEIALGLVNHDDHRTTTVERGGAGVAAELHHTGAGDALGLVDVAGVGVVRSSDTPEAAVEAARFLMSGTSQQYFADTAAEYPMRANVTSTRHDLQDVEELDGPDIDLSELPSQGETRKLLDELGLA